MYPSATADIFLGSTGFFVAADHRIHASASSRAFAKSRRRGLRSRPSPSPALAGEGRGGGRLRFGSASQSGAVTPAIAQIGLSNRPACGTAVTNAFISA